MHPLRSALQSAEEELSKTVPGAKDGLEFWGTSSSPEAHLRWLDRYAEVLALAMTHERFVPLTMPDARSPPSGELLLAWALHRAGVKLAEFPECARIDEDTITLGGTGSSDTCVVYRGPLSLKGTVRVTGTVVVLGDLHVDGVLIDGWASDSALVVIGNERVRAMSAGSDHVVTGNLDAELLTIDSESTSVVCGGTLTARVMIAQYWDAQPGYEFVVKPDTLGPLLDRLTPRPSEELDAYALTCAFGRGEYALTK